VKLPVLAPSRSRANASEAAAPLRARSSSRIDAANRSEVASPARARARSTGRIGVASSNHLAASSRPRSGGRVEAASPKKAGAKALPGRRGISSLKSQSSASIVSEAAAGAAPPETVSEHDQLVRTAWSLVLGKAAEPPPLSIRQLREQLRVHLVQEDAELLPRDDALSAMDALLQWELRQKVLVDTRDLARTKFDARMALWQGDIATLQVGAIVNAANEKGLGCFQPDHRCIDNIIHCAAGPGLRAACHHELQHERFKGKLPTGEAMVTAGFNLPSNFVIHVPGPQCHDGVEQPEMLARCYCNVLEACKAHAIRSVAFCCISTGLFGYPAEGAAKVAISSVRQWLDENSEGDFIDLVVFNVFLKADLEIYQKLLA